MEDGVTGMVPSTERRCFSDEQEVEVIIAESVGFLQTTLQYINGVVVFHKWFRCRR